MAESAQCRYDTFYDDSKLRRDWEHVVLGDATNAVFRRYDASGRDAGFMALVDIGGANGATQDVCKAYDALGRLGSISATVNGASPIAVTNFYDGSRHVGSSIHAGNCVVLRQVVYAQNRDVIESVINSVVTNGVTNVVSRFDYAYDGAGRRTRRVDVAAGIVTNSFGYDTRSQLVTAQIGAVQYGYNLTPYGNRTRSWGQALVNYTPDILNQYDAVNGVEPVYDLEGNLLEIPGRMTMEYDVKNQMTFCSNANYRVWNTYDHLGRRIAKETQYQNNNPSVRHYLYDGWKLIAETLPSASPNHYLWGLDLSGTEQGAGGVGGLIGYLRGTIWFIPLYDGNGNVTGYVNADLGRAVINYEFDAFGKMTSGNPTGIFRFRFSTKYFDTETGLYYYGYRFYDPIWGRWINRDPIGEDGGLNLYGFVDNDPVNGIDFLGEKRVGKWIEPNRKDGWSIWGTGRFPGPGWSGEFRGRPATLFDFAAKFHDLHYELNDLKFGFASGTIGHVLPFIREDGKTLSRKAKADFIFRKMNEVGTEGGVWVGAVNWAARAVFYDDTKYFCKGDDFANALLQPETPRLAKPEEYLMIPYSHLKSPPTIKIVKHWHGLPNHPYTKTFFYPDYMETANEDRSPGLWVWAESVYGETWKKIKGITDATDSSFTW